VPVLAACDYSEVKGETVASLAILTDEPNELIAPYHDRMPVSVVNPEEWLDHATPLDGIAPLALEKYQVRQIT